MMDQVETTAPNPWFSIWTRPRATMRSILDADPKYMVPVLAMLGGFASFLDRALLHDLGDEYSLDFILVVSATLGAVWGFIYVYVFAALLRWTGRWIDGQGGRDEIVAAVAWSNVPLIWGIPLVWLPSLSLFGLENFTTKTPGMDANPMIALPLLGAAIVVAGWYGVIFLKCVAEAQNFSAWKALLNSLLALLTVIAPVIGLGVVWVLLRGSVA